MGLFKSTGRLSAEVLKGEDWCEKILVEDVDR